MIVSGWQNINELVAWCSKHVGPIIWTNTLTNWIGTGWTISRISTGFKLDIVDEKLTILAALRWV